MTTIRNMLGDVFTALGVAILAICAMSQMSTAQGQTGGGSNQIVDPSSPCSVVCSATFFNSPCYTKNGTSCPGNGLTCDKVGSVWKCS